MFFGIGGIFFLAIIGLYIAGALVEPLRWYLIGTASGLLLLCGGLLVLLYARFTLIRIINDQKIQVSDLKDALRKSEAGLKKETKAIEKEVTAIKDDVFLIGYDILKEQNKLAKKVSQLETKAINARRAKRPPKDSTK